MSKILYKEGQEIGPYKAIFIKEVEPKHYSSGNKRMAEFQCGYCGNFFTALISNVKSGKTRSCGCVAKKVKSENGKRNAKNLKGQRFGNLIALEPTEKRNRNQIVWKCQCDCGNIHYAPSAELIRGNVKSCGCVRSFGEQKIQKILENMKITFEKEKWFIDCYNPKTNSKLYFDFYLPDYNCCIEYDGIQHFKQTNNNSSWVSLNDNQYRDNIKNQYCIDHNIKLIRIPYTDQDKISVQYIRERI